jgi:phage-related protein
MSPPGRPPGGPPGWTERIFIDTLRFNEEARLGSSGKKQPTLSCQFYMTATGTEPVRAWLRSLPEDARKEVGSDIQRVQWRWPIGPPLVDGLGHGLYEVRTTVDGNIYRTFFCIDNGVAWLLHGIMKKTQKAPKADLELARRRQRAIEHGEEDQ